MKKLKNYITAVALIGCLFALALPARAQQYTVTTILAGGTNFVAKLYTNTYASSTYAFTATKYEDVALYLGCKSESATNTAADITFVFDKSVDGTLYGTTQRLTIPVTLNGTTAASIVTNITLGPIGYLRLHSIRSTCADDSTTNVYVKVGAKPIRFGYR